MSAWTWLLLALAGGLGAATRFLVDSRVSRWSRLDVPVGTLVVNVSACLLIGVLTGVTTQAPALAAWAPVLGTGFLGGYSTFSTASVEVARLVLADRRPAGAVLAVVMIVASLAAGLLGMALGTALGSL